MQQAITFLKKNIFKPIGWFFKNLALRVVLRIILPATIFTWASLKVVYIPFLSDGEESMITWPTYIKKWANREWFANRLYDPGFFQQNFLVINTTKDLEITKDTTDKQRLNDPGIAITSRKKLVTLFNDLLNNDHLYSMIVCDISFSSASLDTIVNVELRRVLNALQRKNKIIFSAELNKEGKFPPNVMGNLEVRNTGMVNKNSVDGYFLKHQLMDPTTHSKSLPLLMYERIDGGTTEKLKSNHLRFTRQEHSHVMYNTFIPEILFTHEDFDQMKTAKNFAALDSSVVVCDLGTVIREDNALNLRSLLKKKNNKKAIFIGAISHDHADMHNTLYGIQDGAIILLNVYYNLYVGHNKHYPIKKWITFLVFAFVFYLIFFEKEKKGKQQMSVGVYLKKMVLERIYYGILFLYTMVLYFLFHESTNLIALLIAIEIVRGVHGIARNYRFVRKPEAPQNAQ